MAKRDDIPSHDKDVTDETVLPEQKEFATKIFQLSGLTVNLGSSHINDKKGAYSLL